jgi:hypothetical protein
VPTINATYIFTNSATGANGADFQFSIGTGSGTGNRGGNLTINAGAGLSSAYGGSITFNAGSSVGSADGFGGGISFIAGDSSGTLAGGSVQMQGGTGNTGQGGAFVLYGGNSVSGAGGDCQLFAGGGATAAGSLILSDGNITLIKCQYNITTRKSTMGFYNATPKAQAAAYTKTYSTASRTIPNATFTNLSTTAATNVAPYGFSTSTQADEIATKVNALAADVLILKQLIVSLVNDSSKTLGVGLNAT